MTRRLVCCSLEASSAHFDRLPGSPQTPRLHAEPSLSWPRASGMPAPQNAPGIVLLYSSAGEATLKA